MIRILLAEDDAVMREYLARALERSGYAVQMPQARVLSKPFHLRDLVLEVDRLFESGTATGLN